MFFCGILDFRIINKILWTQHCRKRDFFFNLLYGFNHNFWRLEENIDKIMESRHIGIFLIIRKIIKIDKKNVLNFSVIWGIYRQNYWNKNILRIENAVPVTLKIKATK